MRQPLLTSTPLRYILHIRTGGTHTQHRSLHPLLLGLDGHTVAQNSLNEAMDGQHPSLWITRDERVSTQTLDSFV